MKRIFLGLISLLPLMAVADDVVITTAAQLRSLAAEVNAGNSHAGTTVRLAGRSARGPLHVLDAHRHHE